MLVTTELVRDTLCDQLCQIDKHLKAGNHMLIPQHIEAMKSILMSDKDFSCVNIDVWASDLSDLASRINAEIWKKKGHEAWIQQ